MEDRKNSGPEVPGEIFGKAKKGRRRTSVKGRDFKNLGLI
jgi:hypothetical protein